MEPPAATTNTGRTTRRDTTFRAFYAIDLSDEVRNTARDIIETLKSYEWQQHVRWSVPENLHLTLRFLGEVSNSTVNNMNTLLADQLVTVEPFTLMLKEPRLFPHFKKPRVIAVGVSFNESLNTLAAIFENCAVAAGLPPESRQFKGHLTLGRCDKLFPRRTKLQSLPFYAKLPVNHVTLYQSKLTSSGPIYNPLKKLALG